MTREECENKILGKLKKINDIVKQYDESERPSLIMSIRGNYIAINNAYWETKTPLDAIRYDNGKVIHFEH